MICSFMLSFVVIEVVVLEFVVVKVQGTAAERPGVATVGVTI